MHENLKMKIDLNDKEHWQCIAGRQHLGTFYMLYLKYVSYKKIENNDLGIEEHLYTFDFKIQNFSGPITFGLAPKPFPLPIHKSDFVSRIKNEFKPKKVDKILDTETWDIRFEINILPFFKNEEVMKVTYRLAHEMKKDIELDIDIKDDLKAGGLYNPSNPNESLYADPSQWKRDGEDWLKKSYSSVDGNFDPIDDGEGRPGGICYPRRAIIL